MDDPGRQGGVVSALLRGFGIGCCSYSVCHPFSSAVKEEGFQIVVSGDGRRAAAEPGGEPGCCCVRRPGLRQSRRGEELTPRPEQHENSLPIRNGTGPTALYFFAPDVRASTLVSWGVRRQVFCWARGVKWSRLGPSSPGETGNLAVQKGSSVLVVQGS